VLTDSQHSTGECFTKMRCTRDVVEKINETKLEPLPETLEKLHRLVKPLNRSFEPMTINKWIDARMVPEGYKGVYVDITEAEAKKIWAEVCNDHPHLKEVENIPLKSIMGLSWHEQLVAKIHEYNEHHKAVAESEQVIVDDSSYEQHSDKGTSEEQAKKTELEYQKAKDRFWTDEDASGVLKIERAAKIKSKWADACKSQKKQDDETKV